MQDEEKKKLKTSSQNLQKNNCPDHSFLVEIDKDSSRIQLSEAHMQMKAHA